ncbi:ubiquitin-2 like Rad60 SUMO-like-domain-containing protein [Dunaliella salina]|uniref:Ubiquitin-2 like Rad60 SUMO-like-domain-containing protein n=1 Tax=Dunaliella salina TaxID=3046 RepID=A0ABQ7G3B4_DUNSA|nr:ubiquitin-2 like Rad60 SUMO-like-domain-containing protein [Dunaliella salina]|eukprot:KAF5829092.1 ubiquitin-2 like Rad60 SUMO-like-domain-containing protein [Dunaliella salina]
MSEQASSGDSLTIVLRQSSDQSETRFKVKKETPFIKVFKTFCEKKALVRDAIKFAFDGEIIRDDQTPKMLEMQDGDEIDVFLGQTGGSSL